MRLGAEPVALKVSDNVVILEGENIQAASYVDQIAAGFEQMF